MAFSIIGFVACNEEDVKPNSSENASITSRNDQDLTDEQVIQAHVQDIMDFYDQINEWRETPQGSNMDKLEAIEKTEIAANILLGNPTTVYEEYEESHETLTLPAGDSWTPAQTVSFFESISDFLEDNINPVAGDELVALSISDPGSNNEVALFALVGNQPMNPSDVGTLSCMDENCDERWAEAPRGFTNPTDCDGAANDIIGAEANRSIGVYNAINAGPGSGGNTLAVRKIVTRIVIGDHTLFGAAYPQGSDYPRVYTIRTFDTPLQDEHYNDVGLFGEDPDLNCLTTSDLIQFSFGNLVLAENGRSFVPPYRIGFRNFDRDLLCTGVGSIAADAGAPGEPGIQAKYQSHPTRHYWGRIADVIEIDDDDDLEDDGSGDVARI